MAMTPAEMVDFFKEQRQECLVGVGQARDAGNLDAVLTILDNAFECSLMAGLIMWRHRFEGWATALADGLNTARRVVTDCADRRESVWQGFNLGAARHLELLLGEPDALRAASPRPESWASASLDDAEEILDHALLDYARTGNLAREFGEILERIRKPRRLALFAETYQNYSDVIRGALAQDQDAVLGAARKGGELFKRRKRDAFYAGGKESEGGGEDNAHVVDYRLAALLRPGPWIDTLHQEGFLHVWPGNRS